jgi:hypothetical protein
MTERAVQRWDSAIDIRDFPDVRLTSAEARQCWNCYWFLNSPFIRKAVGCQTAAVLRPREQHHTQLETEGRKHILSLLFLRSHPNSALATCASRTPQLQTNSLGYTLALGQAFLASPSFTPRARQQF